MSAFDALANQLSSEPTVAVVAFAHAGYTDDFAFGAGNFGEEQSGVTLGDPTVFAVSRSNPNASSLTFMVNQQSPLGFEFGDVLIKNFSRAYGVHNNEVLLVQDQLRSEPNQHSGGCNHGGNQQVDAQVFIFDGVENCLCQKKAIQQKSYRTPNKIALGPVGNKSFHSSIFAGESLDRKNHKK